MDYRGENTENQNELKEFLAAIVKDLDSITESKCAKYGFNFAEAASISESEAWTMHRVILQESEDENATSLPLTRLN